MLNMVNTVNRANGFLLRLMGLTGLMLLFITANELIRLITY